MKLVIAEKPSVGQSIAKVIGAYERHDGYYEGSGYVVSWCFGHLVELAAPDAYDEKYRKWRKEDLPILPERFRWVVTTEKKAQFALLKNLMSREDVDELICATDAGREGELIFRLVYMKAGCKKPFKRLWISSMEDKSIQEGFASLKDGSNYDNLFRAALCRSEADWLVGINATRLFTTLYDKRLTVGRVQTPTLAMIVERNRQITEFRKEKYYNVHLDSDGLDVVKEKIFSEPEARALKDTCDGADAVVKSVKQTRKTVNPPKLYDLTTLQRESNRYYGYTAQKTLDLTQSLYEKKLVTYPRTDSQYLTEDMAGTAEKLVRIICSVFSCGGVVTAAPDIRRIINNSKVTDHHAIIPTVEIEKQDLTKLSKEELDVLKLIAQQMLCATGQKHEYLETEVIVTCAGQEFKAKGKTVISEGWKAIEAAYKGSLREKDKEAEERVLPPVKEGSVFRPAASISEHFTSPPKAYSEDSLLSGMETAGNDSFDEDTEKKGLGTPATRASIIEKLVSSRYVQRKGKQLIPTEDGINLIAVIPEEVKSAKLTAEWENTLMQMERGEVEPESFMNGISGMVLTLLKKYSTISSEEQKRFSGEKPKHDQIGLCPRCGSPVYEGDKNFYCSNRECKFRLWKETKWLSGMKKKVTKKMAEALLRDGRVFVKGLYSQKTGKTFDAVLLMEDTGEYVNFKLDFGKKRSGDANG